MNPLFPHLLFFGCCALVGIFVTVKVMTSKPRRRPRVARRQRTSEVVNVNGWRKA